MNAVGKITWAMSLIGALALGVVGMWFVGPSTKEPPTTQAPVIKLEKMGYLTSLKVNYSDVIEFNEKRTQGIPWTQWELRLGGTKVLLVAKGDCTVATDLRLAKYENVNPETHTLSLSLRTPKPILARVNHSPRQSGGSYFYAITNQGIEPIIPDNSNRTNAINNALSRAQSEIEKVCNQADVIASAKKNTQDVLMPTFQALGWNVKFLWK